MLQIGFMKQQKEHFYVIYYLVQPGYIEIIRVLHANMNKSDHLQ